MNKYILRRSYNIKPIKSYALVGDTIDGKQESEFLSSKEVAQKLGTVDIVKKFNSSRLKEKKYIFSLDNSLTSFDIPAARGDYYLYQFDTTKGVEIVTKYTVSKDYNLGNYGGITPKQDSVSLLPKSINRYVIACTDNFLARTEYNGGNWLYLGYCDNFLCTNNTNLLYIYYTTIADNIHESGCNNCTNIKTYIQIPDNVKTVNLRAFYKCVRLKGDLDVNNIVKTGASAFESAGFDGTLNLRKIEYVENYSFKAVKFKGELKLPNTIIRLGGSTFSYNSKYTSLVFEAGFQPTILSSNTFASDSGIKQILNLPSTIEEIGSYTFQNCSSLYGTLDLSHVKTIGDSAFSGCSGLDSTLILSDKLTKINKGVFFGCNKLVGPLNLENVTYIGDNAFDHCRSLKAHNLDISKVSYLGTHAFAYCNSFSGTMDINNSTIKNLYTFTFVDESQYFPSLYIDTIKIAKNIDNIEHSVFRGMNSNLQVYMYWNGKDGDILEFNHILNPGTGAGENVWGFLAAQTLHVPEGEIPNYEAKKYSYDSVTREGFQTITDGVTTKTYL